MVDTLLDRVRTYLRFSESDQVDAELQMYVDAAIEYLKNAGVSKSESELSCQAIAMVVAQWYENRLDDNGGLGSPVVGLRSIITQLSYCKEGSHESR